MKRRFKMFCLIMAIVMFCTSFSGITAFAANQEKPILTVEMISDTHIGVKGTSETLAIALDNMAKERKSIDALVISGDLSNDGSEEYVNEFYDILGEHNKIRNTIPAAGNHDMGQMTYSGKETRERLITAKNNSLNSKDDNIYYSTEVNGYKFIVLGDDGENINCTTISNEQLNFLDKELAEGTKDGKPAFVICHWPPAFINGSWLLWPIWPGGNIDMFTTFRLMSIMEKYDNVFFISGHLHMGLNNNPIQNYFRLGTFENHGKTAYVNLPSLGKTCRFGIKDTGSGIEFRIYKNRVEMFGRNYVTGKYYDSCTYSKELV